MINVGNVRVGNAGDPVDPQDAVNLRSLSASWLSASEQVTVTEDISNWTLDTATNLYLTASEDVRISGIVHGASLLTFTNVGTHKITFSNLDNESMAANQFLFGSDILLNLNATLTIFYDQSVAFKWRKLTL